MFSRGWTWVACLAVLFAGLGNAHLHYCFDGQEPPVSVHLTDGIDPGHDHHDHTGHAPDHEPDQEHHDDLDVDLDLGNNALAKTFKFDQPDFASPSGWSVIVAAPRASVLRDWIELPRTPEPSFARPQARGPPA
jgi:hypothetical protein